MARTLLQNYGVISPQFSTRFKVEHITRCGTIRLAACLEFYRSSSEPQSDPFYGRRKLEENATSPNVASSLLGYATNITSTHDPIKVRDTEMS